MSDADLRAVEAHEDEKERRGMELDKLTLQNVKSIYLDPDQIGQYLTSEFNDELNMARVQCKNDAAKFMAIYDDMLSQRIEKAAEKMAQAEIDNRLPTFAEGLVSTMYPGYRR